MKSERPTRDQLIELAKTDPEAIADLVLMLWDRMEILEAKVAESQQGTGSLLPCQLTSYADKKTDKII